MPYCPNCGEEVSEEAEYCPNCGIYLSKGLGTARRTSLGLEENVEGALAYLLGFVSDIILFILEKKSRFVRFHALQSTIIFLGLFIAGMILTLLPFMGIIVSLAGLIAWIVGIIKAYQGEYYKFPIVGDIAEDHI